LVRIPYPDLIARCYGSLERLVVGFRIDALKT